MREQRRIYVISQKLLKLWEENPDLRFGQLVVCIASCADSKADLFNLEDDKFQDAIARFRNKEK